MRPYSPLVQVYFFFDVNRLQGARLPWLELTCEWESEISSFSFSLFLFYLLPSFSGFVVSQLFSPLKSHSMALLHVTCHFKACDFHPYACFWVFFHSFTYLRLKVVSQCKKMEEAKGSNTKTKVTTHVKAVYLMSVICHIPFYCFTLPLSKNQLDLNYFIFYLIFLSFFFSSFPA